MLDLDPDAVARSPAVFAAPTSAEVFGWLYVVEGSTLGGVVIERRALGPLLGPLGVRLRSFRPYPDGPGPMWRAYLDALDAWVGADELRAERVVAAGVTVFDALEHWAAPVFDEAAA